MPRLQADADKTLWVAVTDSLGFGGRRHRKAAIRMLLSQASRAMGAAERPGGGFMAWAMSQATPFLMSRAAGRVLVWVWKADPELLVVMAQVQEATPQLRAAASKHADGVRRHRGVPRHPPRCRREARDPAAGRSAHAPVRDVHVGHRPHFVVVTAVCSDRERFGTVIGAVDELARTLRISDDVALGESPNVLRIEP